MLPNMGEDSEQSAYFASLMNCIVLDADYSKAPEYQHPSALHDALDIVNYVQSRPDLYDSSRMTIGGVSAGACVAMLAAHHLPKDTFKSLIAWYPVTNCSLNDEQRRVEPLPRGAPGFPLPLWMIRMFISSVCPTGQDLTDPAVSPYFAPSSVFPPTLFIVRSSLLLVRISLLTVWQVGENDPLYRDSVDTAERLKADGVDCELVTVADAGHAFDRSVVEGTPQWIATKVCMGVVERRLRTAYALPDEKTECL